MDIMTHGKFYFNRLMLTLIFAIRASEPPRAWRTTEKARPDRVKLTIEQSSVTGIVGLRSVQSTLSHLISTSVLRATFTRFFVEHGLFQHYLY